MLSLSGALARGEREPIRKEQHRMAIDTATGKEAPAEISSERVKDIFSTIAKKYERFNAISMRDRLAVAEATVPTAFVVETGEPYYYVIASSWPTLAEAAAALKTLQTNPPIPLRPPLPYILRPTAK